VFLFFFIFEKIVFENFCVFALRIGVSPTLARAKSATQTILLGYFKVFWVFICFVKNKYYYCNV